jgi:hypothetical protein
VWGCCCVLGLQELPDALCGLHLVLLDMTNNCLRRLPPALGHMTTLRSIPLVRGSAWGQHTSCAVPAWTVTQQGVVFSEALTHSAAGPPCAGRQPTQADAQGTVGRWAGSWQHAVC